MLVGLSVVCFRQGPWYLECVVMYVRYTLCGCTGWAGGKRKQLRIELGNNEEARVDLTRNAPDEKS